jgi:hypothetical protein
MGYIRNLPKMCWADGAKVKLEADQQLVVLLGPKTDQDRQPLENTKGGKGKDKKPAEANNKPKESQSKFGSSVSFYHVMLVILSKLCELFVQVQKR